MLNDVNDLFVLLREKDWEGMAVWLCNYVEIAPDTEAEHAKVIEFDGFLLLPIFQMHHAEASMHLLHHPQVRSVLSNACVSHHKWMVKLANTDPQAFVWGLEQGWGRVLTPRQSSFKAYETMRCYDFVGKHLREVRWKAQAEGKSLMECDAYIARAQNAWDSWMRQTNKRNPALNAYLYQPSHDELVALALCSKRVSLRDEFWAGMDTLYLGTLEKRALGQALYNGVGTQWGMEQDYTLLGQCLGLSAPTVEVTPLPAGVNSSL